MHINSPTLKYMHVVSYICSPLLFQYIAFFNDEFNVCDRLQQYRVVEMKLLAQQRDLQVHVCVLFQI